ncbi:MAG TPA: FecR domain-containing protein [Candidatus Binataceae bacterium]|nr:FecR domain-containing protein [Candidatus Binataceae bacterium]
MIQLNFRRFAIAAFAVTALVMASTLPALASAGSVGTITLVSGNALLQRGPAATPITTNEPVMLHDTITTGPGADVGIYMADGSTLSITESSIAEIEDSTMVNGNAVISRVKLIKGRVHANVPDVAGTPTRRLQIDSANANVVGPAPSYVH